MKKQILIAVISLALLSGCSGKPSGNNASGNAPAADTTPVTATKAPALPIFQQPDEEKLQAVAPDLVTGEKVYKGTCSICHKSGLKGAPRLGIKGDWEERLTQSKEILYKHAVHGFIGKRGSMPSRGSNSKLSEAEVKAAVDYMVVHAIPAWTMEK